MQIRTPYQIMKQSWHDLLFLHWAFEPEEIQRTLQDSLYVDTYGNQAFVGIVPFRMSDVQIRYFPKMLWLSSFSELNLRTYVKDREGRKGVWFYSLDANHHLVVWIARRFFALPYVYSQMAFKRASDGFINFTSHRKMNASEPLRYAYRGLGSTRSAKPGSLDSFLLERYRFFSFLERSNQILTGSLRHAPYRIENASVDIISPELFALNGLRIPVADPVHQAYVSSVDVEVFSPEVTSTEIQARP